MLSQSEAQSLFEKAMPSTPVQAWARYRDLYLFRVIFPLPGEEDSDPFFSVDVVSGEIRDFSVLTDGKLSEIVKLKWTEI